MANVMVYGNASGYNDAQTIFASVARTATPTAVTINNLCASGLHLVINVTAKTSSPSIVVSILGIDPVSGATYTILAGAAITATGTTVLKVFPGALGDPDLVANDFIPKGLQIAVVHANANSMTYSVGAMFLR